MMDISRNGGNGAMVQHWRVQGGWYSLLVCFSLSLSLCVCVSGSILPNVLIVFEVCLLQIVEM